ncbi:hypothetical protein CPB97_001194 [Podila verticillata]|nr:hypothetical protein CPB97_001194 [Podila verticillata]
MECLRNLPSKTNAFSTATYERVRSSHGHQRPYFSTANQPPRQIVVPSSDDNLILAAIQRMKQIKSTQPSEPPKRSTTPEISPETESSQNRRQEPPRLYKRPRIALSAAASGPSQSTTPNSGSVSRSSAQSSNSSSPRSSS